MTGGFYLVFGLTADPPHKGHEQVIINSYQHMKKLGLEVGQFDLVPTFEPNLIADKKQPQTSYAHRLNMCQIVANDLNQKHQFNVHANDIEEILATKTGRKSYSYETLKAINHPNKLFVLSADHFAGRWPKFRKWHKWQALVKENGLLIHQRPGHRINVSFIQQLKQINPDVYVAEDYASIKVSSTLLRSQLKHKQKLTTLLLDSAVMEYISKHQLYI